MYFFEWGEKLVYVCSGNGIQFIVIFVGWTFSWMDWEEDWSFVKIRIEIVCVCVCVCMRGGEIVCVCVCIYGGKVSVGEKA